MSLMQIKLEPKVFLKTALETLSTAAAGKGISLQTAFSDNLPESFYCDKMKLTQTLTTLLDHAIRRSSTGTVMVRMSIEKANGDGNDRLGFVVQDEGQILDGTKISQVLDLTASIGSLPKEYSSSEIGIGLRMSSKLISLMGGAIRYESIENKYNRFVFTLPSGQSQNPTADAAAKPAMQPTPQQAVSNPEKQSSEKALIQANKAAQDSCQDVSATVLVVDDIEENRVLVEILLKKMGHRVEFCANGQEAIDACQKKAYDVILMDIQMPVMDGLEATQKIRESGLNTKTTILAMTASGQKKDEFAALDAGCDDNLPKPVDRKKLERKLWRIVEKLRQMKDAELGRPIISFLEGDSDYQKAIETFIENLPGRINEIKSAFEKGDLKDLGFKVHTLKGLGGFAGFPVFTEKAKLMEQSIKANELDVVQKQVDELVNLCLRTKLKEQEKL